MRTFSHTSLDTCDAVAELLLGCTEILVRGGEVLHLVVELFLDLRQLLGGKAAQVNCILSEVIAFLCYAVQPTLLPFLAGGHCRNKGPLTWTAVPSHMPFAAYLLNRAKVANVLPQAPEMTCSDTRSSIKPGSPNLSDTVPSRMRAASKPQPTFRETTSHDH